MLAKDTKEFGLKEKIEQENNLVKGLKVKFTIIMIISNLFTYSLSIIANDSSDVKSSAMTLEAPKDHTLLKLRANLFIDEKEVYRPVSIMDQNETIIYKQAIFYKAVRNEGGEEEYLVYIANSELKKFKPKIQNLYSIIPYINYIEKKVLKENKGGSFETYL